MAVASRESLSNAPTGASEQPRAVIVSGAGRYADPWHPFQRTSRLLAGVLTDAGFAVTVDDDLDAAMTRLQDVALLVVNAGDPWRNAEPRSVAPASLDGFRDAVTRGIGILALHTAPATMRDYPEWAAIVGAIWLPGISMHPPADEALITVTDTHLAGVRSFDVFDERYCKLQPVGLSETVATHVADGTTYPTAWTRTVGATRVAVDVLGHDERSYESAGHRRLLTALAQWAGQVTG